MPAFARRDHVVLCGLNELGYRTLEELRRLGEDVVVITRAPRRELAEGARRLDVAIIDGHYRDEAVLREADVTTAAALVITEDDDVGNLHAALAAQELNRDLRIRVRMFNPQLGARVQRLFSNCRVFDAAALAAPAFVAAALYRDWRQRVEVDGHSLVVRRGSATDPDVLLPLARIRPDGTSELFPAAGDGLLCLARGLSPGVASGRARLGARGRPRRLRALVSAAAEADPRLRRLAVLVGALALASVVVFWRAARLNLVDALYFTVTVITTTGFGDIHLRDAPVPLQLYGVGLMLVGTTLLTILFALIADAIVGARLARELGGVPRGLRDHVVVCGLGNIGYRVVEELARLEVPTVAVELQHTNRFLPTVRGLGVPVLVADARLSETLRAVNVAQARCLVVVTSDDLANLETALTARADNPDLRVVLRLFDPDLAARVERVFGIHISRSPSALAAPVFAAAAQDEHVVATISAGIPVLVVARTRVEGGCPATGATVGWLEERTHSRVIRLQADRDLWRPAATTPLAVGQELVVVVARSRLADVLTLTGAPSA